MNKKLFLAAAITALVLLSSCLTSLHRLATHTTVTSDRRITGSWQYDQLQVKVESFPESRLYKDIVARNVNKDGGKTGYDNKEDSLLYSKAYVIDFISEGHQYYMICCLVRLGNNIFADIEPAFAMPVNKLSEKDMVELFYGGSYIPSHSIAKVVFRNNEMEFRFLDGSFISQQLENGRVAISHEKDELFNTSLITASSADLQSFITKYGSDERLYSRENTVILKKILP